GTPDLDEPHLKVSFLDASKNKVGDLLSQQITSAPIVVAQPVTPEPVASTPVPGPGTPASLPSNGNTTVREPETVVVTTPAAETGTTPPIPVPPPLLVTQPALVLEPVSQEQGSNEVPEPQSIALLLGGLALMGGALRKRG
ncbi:MAG: PEP-CTERM sorting domain-containing protein, partial [Telluria sp.]